MLRVGSWLTPKSARLLPHRQSSRSLNTLDEPKYLEEALRAATLIINDDVQAAEEGLNKGNSSFHKLGKGIVLFIKATLGFEQDVMREALERINDAEATASNDLRKAQRDAGGGTSALYPPGSEFALCQAESQLLAAVVAVLTESLTESLKGFYKLRKAYMTLSGLIEIEKNFAQNGTAGTSNSNLPPSVASPATNPQVSANGDEKSGHLMQDSAEGRNGKSGHASSTNERLAVRGAVDDEDEVFFDAPEMKESDQSGVADNPARIPQKEMSSIPSAPGTIPSVGTQAQDSAPKTAEVRPDNGVVANPVDLFIQSGTGLCFGLLLVMISMIPPAFGKLLAIVGFRGDRERGLTLLWQVTKISNINGAMAGLVLLGFYNGIAGFCDILPDDVEDVVDGYPERRCKELLAEMRGRYPKSHLWLLEEARMRAADFELEESNELLKGSVNSQLKQIDALAMFERSLNSLFMHDYEDATSCFLECVTMNNWSHAMYFFTAGAAQIELYRKLKEIDPNQAAVHAKRAEEYMMKVPGLSGKKWIMARQLPFDVHVLRKVRKWQQRAHELSLDFVDAIGVSPAEEMIYLWNGYKRMRPEHLQVSLDALAWSETHNPRWDHEPLEEKAILSLLRAAIKRTQGQIQDARTLLLDNIIRQDRLQFKGFLKDDWTCPSAHYEMAVICWMERAALVRTVADGASGQDHKGAPNDKDAQIREKTKECGEWLDKVAAWESFTLDARIGLKATTAQGTLRKCRVL